MDTLLMAAQGYQESRLIRTPRAGRRDRRDAGDARDGQGAQRRRHHQLEPNIHAGVKYVRFMMDKYYAKSRWTR
jgi:hypothetical protein